MRNRILKIFLALIITMSFGLVAVGCTGSDYSPMREGEFQWTGDIYLASWLVREFDTNAETESARAGLMTMENAYRIRVRLGLEEVPRWITDEVIERVNEERHNIITLFEGTEKAKLTIIPDEEDRREGDADLFWKNREWNDFRFEGYNDIYRPINLPPNENVPADWDGKGGLTAGPWHISVLKFRDDYLYLTVSVVENRTVNGEARRVVVAEFELRFELQK